ncbi:MAG: hypothetical protein QOK42_2287 [Frankiaceae bacterium]|nr:hypothetical protein [Frankiaceae bacterium]
MTKRSDRLGRLPGFVFAACAAVLVALVASAFSPAQPPPPPTAEYAPSAVAPIKDPPPQQVSQQGDNTGKGGKGDHQGTGTGTGRQTPSPRPSASGGDEKQLPPGTNPCYGSPPRQTPDPESPPCVTRDISSGENGGETATGVDANSITISLITDDAAQGNALVRYFNSHFNLYGRNVVVSQKTEGCFGGSPQSMRNTAKTNADAGIFAAVGFCDTKGREGYYYDELARRGVVSVANRMTISTETDMAKHHPYEWSFLPTFDVGQRHSAELACALRGRPASHAGSALSGQTRKFGVFYNTYTDSPEPNLDALKSTFNRCGIDADLAGVTLASDGGPGGQGYTQESIQQVNTALGRMSREGVTSLVVLTHVDTTKQIAQYASGQGYQPELMLSSYFYNDVDQYAATLPSDQLPHVFGVSLYNRFIHPKEEDWYPAIAEGDPTYNYPYAHLSYDNALYLYKPLLTLFSGLQMAGPHLTAKSFAAGLQGTSEVWTWKEVAEAQDPGVYPNPSVPGHTEGKVTVHPGQHSYIADASVIWLSPGTADSEYASPSSYCYLGHGHRFTLGSYTAAIDNRIGTEACGRYG